MRYFANVEGVKKRVSHKLCNRDAEHHSTTCDAVLALRDEHMVTTRKPKPQPTTDTLICDYLEQVYLPTVKQGLKPSTVAGYQDIWEQHLKDHFAGRPFQAYEPVDGNKLLNDLVARKYGQRTILTELTGNPIAAQQALCHLDLSTTMRHYIKTKRSALAEGIQMLDERLALSK